MDIERFNSLVRDADEYDYVPKRALRFLADGVDFEVIDRSALEKEDINQRPLVSRATTGDQPTKGEAIDLVREILHTERTDIQFYQLMHDGEPADYVQIWRHKYGYSAFALSSSIEE